MSSRMGMEFFLRYLGHRWGHVLDCLDPCGWVCAWGGTVPGEAVANGTAVAGGCWCCVRGSAGLLLVRACNVRVRLSVCCVCARGVCVCVCACTQECFDVRVLDVHVWVLICVADAYIHCIYSLYIFNVFYLFVYLYSMSNISFFICTADACVLRCLLPCAVRVRVRVRVRVLAAWSCMCVCVCVCVCVLPCPVCVRARVYICCLIVASHPTSIRRRADHSKIS